MACLCPFWRGQEEAYLPKDDANQGSRGTASSAQSVIQFAHISEPHLTELAGYVKQRGDHIQLLHTAADVRTKLMHNVTEDRQLIDTYPKGRQFLADDEYMIILRDLLNLSNILDDMEQTGWVPYQSRTPYYNLYTKLYRLLLSKAGR